MRIIQALALMALLACNKNPKPPPGILAEDKMADILADIHLAEARVSRLELRSLDSSVVVFNQLQQEIWAKYSVDSALYNKSFVYFVSNPEALNSLYEKVTERLKSVDSTTNSQNQFSLE